MWDLKPRLEGRIVTLEPLALEHRDAIVEAARAQEAWEWWSADMSTPAAVDAWLQSSLEASERGERSPFATLDTTSGQAIGSTSFMTVHPEHAALEIGWTWLSPAVWNSGANVEAKLLMLRHAFAVLGCQRVDFWTHEQNERSRRALAALPAQFEGIIREHRILWDGSRRSSAVYSILDSEWSAVEANLETRLRAH